jgi:hypothetical protein
MEHQVPNIGIKSAHSSAAENLAMSFEEERAYFLF